MQRDMAVGTLCFVKRLTTAISSSRSFSSNKAPCTSPTSDHHFAASCDERRHLAPIERVDVVTTVAERTVSFSDGGIAAQLDQ